jgi:hypothetical protein
LALADGLKLENALLRECAVQENPIAVAAVFQLGMLDEHFGVNDVVIAIVTAPRCVTLGTLLGHNSSKNHLLAAETFPVAPEPTPRPQIVVLNPVVKSMTFVVGHMIASQELLCD